ncbi:MAG: hypothetical protein ACK5O8_17090 [Pirellula sp.]
MRSDMAKVIVERPRIGSRRPSRKKGYRKYLQSMAVDELPRREPMLGQWRGREKWLNEHLGPMRRFLRSKIGLPWNNIHRELCEYVSFDNAVQGHVLAHIYEYVHLHVEVENDATVYSKSGRRRQHKLEVNAIYVCPNSGILTLVKACVRHQPRTRIPISESSQYLHRDNFWWEVQFRTRYGIAGDRWDVWLERDVSKLTEQDCIMTYGGNYFATSKRPLTPEETRQLYRRLRLENRSNRVRRTK